MPSAEKVTKLETKLEVIQPLDQKAPESVSKEGDQNNGEKSSLPPIQQGLQVIQNKIRNLEKRKNKLDGYIKEEEEGRELSNEQKKAVQKYDEVVNQLGISKEFCKQIQAIATLASKEAKREARKASFLRTMQETTKVREVVIIQDMLKQLKNERVRNDFLQGSNGACLVEVEEMNVLEQFSKHTTPVHPNFSNEPSFFTSAKTAADHLSFLVDGRNRQFLETGFTYEKIKELFSRIQTCGYWEKDIKIVEDSSSSSPPPSSITQEHQLQERPAESETPQSSVDLEIKDEKIEMVEMKAPLPAQVPNPTQLFNGGNPMMAHHHHRAVPIPQPQQQQQQQAQQIVTLKPVTAVENAFYNQMKYSASQQQPGNAMGLPPPPQPIQQQQQANRFIEDFATSSISFLQDSLVEQQQQNQHQQNQQNQQPPKHSPVQQNQPSSQGNAVPPMNAFHHQAPQHHYPPGLKLNHNNASNIPVNFTQASQTQHSNVPPHFQQSVYPPVTVSQQPQYPQQKMPTNIQNLQDIEQKTTALAAAQQQQPMPTAQPTQTRAEDLSENRTNASTAQPTTQQAFKEEKNRNNNNDWNGQQPPQIDTWTNETSMGGSGNASGGNQGGNYSRYNRNRADRGNQGGGSKYNNYRGGAQQQSRNNYNNENGGDSAGGSSSTFFRNNERYSGGGNRFNDGNRGGFNKQRDGNYRAGSGRFPAGGGGSAVPMASGPRK